ncbi:chitosanase [Dactylosporangium sp. CA-233914]|uniref:chitosanase n=1 Tax=Dactylosporangium sp. CA-233914 TaxID=3239934 RepID=UPI003D8A78F1
MAARRTTFVLAAAVTVVAAGSVLGVPSAYAADTVISKGRPATASAGVAAKAFDGKTSTRWTVKGRAAQWLRVDLGAANLVSRVRLTWGSARPSAYRVEISADGTAWTPIAATAGLNATGRYVRLTATPRGSAGLALGELEVFGHRAAESTPVKATPGPDLNDPAKKDVAMRLVSSAENSSLDWKAQYQYIEDIGDGRGYTAGIIGFCSGTGDMLELVERYTQRAPGNALAKYLPALRNVNGSASHTGLDPTFTNDWRTAATDPAFQQTQNDERDRVYFNPAVNQAKTDGLRALGQFIYYDAIVMHGPGTDPASFGGIRNAAMTKAKTPAQGGDETTYLNAFLDARVAAMKTEEAHSDTSRVDTAQRVFLRAGNLDLNTPLSWKVYGDPYTIAS